MLLNGPVLQPQVVGRIKNSTETEGFSESVWIVDFLEYKGKALATAQALA